MNKFKIGHFEKILPTLSPRLRQRAYLAFEVPSHFLVLRVTDTFSYRVVAEHLGVAVASEITSHGALLTDSAIGVDRTFDECVDIAIENLRQRQLKPVADSGLHAISSDDDDAASHILLTDTLRELKVDGDLIVQVPSDGLLLACGSNDPHALERMAQRTIVNIETRQPVSGFAFRLADDSFEPWLPPKEHPSFRQFRNLELASYQDAYDSQRQAADPSDGYPATYFRVYLGSSGEPVSLCTLTENVPAIFPKTDLVSFTHFSEASQEYKPLGFMNWREFRQLAGELIQRHDSYPECWSVGLPESLELLQRVSEHLIAMTEITADVPRRRCK